MTRTNAKPIVAIESGKVSGVEAADRQVAVFKGVPYARPPQSEDCLYLNVYSPTLDRAAKLPVMVRLHGGDHQVGSSSDRFYDSDILARQGVVLVTINYRLGLMGYFAHPQLSLESAHKVSGNYGTLDQIAALHWVQANISQFGGDPDNVTIFGESTGGESVAYMLTSPLAQGLFHKAIRQSPANSHQMIHLTQPFLNYPALASHGQKFADLFAAPGPGQLENLRQVPAEKLYQRLLAVISSVTTSLGQWCTFMPVRRRPQGSRCSSISSPVCHLRRDKRLGPTTPAS